MGVVLASELNAGSFKKKQIQAVESGNPFKRLVMVFSVIATRVRLLSKSRQKTIDLGIADGSAEAEQAQGHVQTFWLVQSYLILLLLLDIFGSLLLLAAGLLLAFTSVEFLLGAKDPAVVTWVRSLPVLPAVADHVGNLFLWIQDAMFGLFNTLKDTQLPGKRIFAADQNSTPLRVVPPALGFMLCWFVIKTLRNNIISNLKAVL